MRIEREFWVCVDCLLVLVNGDDSGVPEDRLAAVHAGVEALGAHVVPHFDTETGEGHYDFAKLHCGCCDSGLAGEFHRMAVLG